MLDEVAKTVQQFLRNEAERPKEQRVDPETLFHWIVEAVNKGSDEMEVRTGYGMPEGWTSQYMRVIENPASQAKDDKQYVVQYKKSPVRIWCHASGRIAPSTIVETQGYASRRYFRFLNSTVTHKSKPVAALTRASYDAAYSIAQSIIDWPTLSCAAVDFCGEECNLPRLGEETREAKARFGRVIESVPVWLEHCKVKVVFVADREQKDESKWLI